MAQLVPIIDDDEDAIYPTEDDNEYEISSTTTLRSTSRFATRNRKTISTQPSPSRRTSSIKTTTTIDNNLDEYDGDFKYFRNTREFLKKLLAQFKNFLGNININDIIKRIQRFFTKNDDDD